jgi:hypothetical protein
MRAGTNAPIELQESNEREMHRATKVVFSYVSLADALSMHQLHDQDD